MRVRTELGQRTQRLAPVPWFTMPVAMMALFGYGLDLLARQADHQMARRLRAEHSREVERAEKDASREAARLLHDHVLHALHAISRGSGGVPHATHVEVMVAEHGSQWHITIRDDGRGFDPARAPAPPPGPG